MQSRRVSMIEAGTSASINKEKSMKQSRTGSNSGKSQKIVDIAGQRFGRLLVLSMAGKNSRNTVLWTCICDCGNAAVVLGTKLRSGHTISCGCAQRDASRLAQTSHGMRRTPEYNIWRSMKSRCYKKTNAAYHNYGGRGIEVCESWRESFTNFIADMGKRPSDSHSIDRIDNDGHYEPGNCHWSTAVIQGNNKRNNLRLEVEGKNMTIAEWARERSIPYATLIQRISRYGWSAQQALGFEPPPRRNASRWKSKTNLSPTTSKTR